MHNTCTVVGFDLHFSQCTSVTASSISVACSNAPFMCSNHCVQYLYTYGMGLYKSIYIGQFTLMYSYLQFSEH